MLFERLHLRYVSMRIVRRLRKLTARFCLPVRKFCLPAISLTRTPGGRHMEWAAAFFDPVLEQCERGVYLIGLVGIYIERVAVHSRLLFNFEEYVLVGTLFIGLYKI